MNKQTVFSMMIFAAINIVASDPDRLSIVDQSPEQKTPGYPATPTDFSALNLEDIKNFSISDFEGFYESCKSSGRRRGRTVSSIAAELSTVVVSLGHDVSSTSPNCCPPANLAKPFAQRDFSERNLLEKIRREQEEERIEQIKRNVFDGGQGLTPTEQRNRQRASQKIVQRTPEELQAYKEEKARVEKILTKFRKLKTLIK